MRILLNFQARYSHARRIRQAQISLRPSRFGGGDFNFSRARARMVVKCLLLGD
jgi:hypothetical protein